MLLVGESFTLTAVPTDASGHSLTRRIEWTSSNSGVATVTTAGIVSGVSVGTTTITAGVEGIARSVDLTVRVGLQVPGSGATDTATSSVFGGAVTMAIPPGAVSPGMTLSVAPAAPATLAPSSELLAGTAFDFGPAGTQFTKQVQLALQFDPAKVPVTDRTGLAIVLLTDGAWVEVPGSVVDLARNRVSVSISHFSTYAILWRPTPSAVTIDAGNNQSAVTGTPVAIRPSVKVVDGRGNPIAGAPVSFGVASGGGTIAGGAQLTNSAGVATVGMWTVGAVGTNTLSATVAALPRVTFTATATKPAAVATAMVKVAGDFGTATTGSAVSARPAVKVLDADGAAMSGVPVTFAIVSGGGTIIGAVQVTDANGVATVGAWTLGAVGTNTLTATAASLPSLTFSATSVARGPVATSMVIYIGDGQSAYAGSPVFQQPAVLVLDERGVVMRGVPVTFSVVRGGGTITGAAQITDFNGMAQVGSWTLTVGDNALAASTPGIPPITFTAQGLPIPLHGAPTALFTLVPPATVNTSVTFATQPVIEVRDYYGDRVTTATNAVRAAIFSGTGTLLGQTTVNAVNGVATFTDLGIAGTGAYSIQFSSPGLSGLLANVQVARIVDHLAVAQLPTCAQSGVTFRVQPAVDLRDAADVRVPFATNTVTASIANGAGTLGGQTSVAAVDGRATFSNLSITGTGPFTLSYATSGLASISSPSFTVSAQPCASAGVATRLLVASQSAQTTSGRPDASFTIYAVDANGDLDTRATGAVTIATASGSGTLASPATASLVSGVAQFNQVQVNGSGLNSFLFSSPGLSSVTSAPVNVLQAAIRLVITRQPVGSTNGALLATQPIITLLDDAGLPVVTRSYAITAMATSGLNYLSGTTTVSTVNGVATFTNLVMNGVGNTIIAFTNPSVIISVISGTVTTAP